MTRTVSTVWSLFKNPPVCFRFPCSSVHSVVSLSVSLFPSLRLWLSLPTRGRGLKLNSVVQAGVQKALGSVSSLAKTNKQKRWPQMWDSNSEDVSSKDEALEQSSLEDVLMDF